MVTQTMTNDQIRKMDDGLPLKIKPQRHRLRLSKRFEDSLAYLQLY